jgi:hypothetical protein
MDWPHQYTPYIWPMVTGAGLGAALGIYSWRHRSAPGAAGLLFALEYAGGETWFNRRTFTLVAIPILTSPPLYFTNSVHHLIWTHLWMDGRIQYHSEVLNCVLGGYGVLLGIMTLSAFIGLFVQSPLHRWPAGLIFLNLFVVRGLWFLDAGDSTRSSHSNWPTWFQASSPWSISWCSFQFRLFDVVPVARNSAIHGRIS